jgi:hypothetical protein
MTTKIRFVSYFSEGFNSSRIHSRILRVILTIFGFGSLIILIILGKIVFIDAENSGLFLFDCILKRRSSAASVLSFKLP